MAVRTGLCWTSTSGYVTLFYMFKKQTNKKTTTLGWLGSLSSCLVNSWSCYSNCKQPLSAPLHVRCVEEISSGSLSLQAPYLIINNYHLGKHALVYRAGVHANTVCLTNSDSEAIFDKQ